MTDIRAYFYVCTTGGHSKYYFVHGTGDGSGCEVYHGRISALAKWSGFSHHYHYPESPEAQIEKKKRKWWKNFDEYVEVFEGIDPIEVHVARTKKWAQEGSHAVTPADVIKHLGSVQEEYEPELELVGAGFVGKGWFNNGR